MLINSVRDRIGRDQCVRHMGLAAWTVDISHGLRVCYWTIDLYIKHWLDYS